MFSLLAETEPSSLAIAFQWMPWIILIAVLVAVFLALLVKGIYLVLHIFGKKG